MAEGLCRGVGIGGSERALVLEVGLWGSEGLGVCVLGTFESSRCKEV